MAARQTVVLRGRAVTLAEGDVLLHSDHTWLSAALGLFNRGWSHASTVVRLDERLVCFSVYVDGVFMEPLEQFNSPAFKHLAVVRPRVPRTQQQCVAQRLAAASVLQVDQANGHSSYDGLAEYVATALRLPRATRTRYHCAELVGVLARAAGDGAWPLGAPVNRDLPTVAHAIGETHRLF